MNVIITGGAGFIGSHLADTFIEAGHDVYIIDDLSNGKPENVHEKARFEKMDIKTGDLNSLFQSIKPRCVCHHAAQMSVRDSVADPIADLKTNILGMVRLLDAGRAAGVEYFIMASTSGALYGDIQTFPAPETHPIYPLSPYGVSKLAGEKYLYFFRRQYGIKGVALRYANVYGPRQDPHGEAGVVAIFCRKLLDKETPTINGDGKQTRDFIYVGDIARANIMALEKGVEGEFNISTGVETDINELADVIKEVARSEIEFQHGPPMPGEQIRSVVDPSLAGKIIGWKPTVSLQDGLKKTWQFFNKK